MELFGRRAATAALDRLLDRAADGAGSGLVVWGEPGIGKTALLDQARQRAEQRVGCAAGTLTVREYRDLLAAAGLVQIAVTLSADHGDGVHSAIVQAVKPAIGPGLEIRPMRGCDAEQVPAIYQAGLDTGQASFETLAPRWGAPRAGCRICGTWQPYSGGRIRWCRPHSSRTGTVIVPRRSSYGRVSVGLRR